MLGIQSEGPKFAVNIPSPSKYGTGS